jgi:hypothetical protein
VRFNTGGAFARSIAELVEALPFDLDRVKRAHPAW